MFSIYLFPIDEILKIRIIDMTGRCGGNRIGDGQLWIEINNVDKIRGIRMKSMSRIYFYHLFEASFFFNVMKANCI